VSRLVVVSNRLPTLTPAASPGEPQVPVGGLASALLGALRRTPGSLWFGWSGKVAERGKESRLRRQSIAGVDLVGMPLTKAEIDDYYLGFCNQALWPLFHCFQERASIRLRQEAAYRKVQRRFAAALMPLLKPGDLIWVHDYHLLFLGRELRRLGWTGRIGFFLHIPFPPYELWQLLPDPRDWLEAMLDYDLVGYHVQGFLDNYVYCCRRELNAAWDGSTLRSSGRSQSVGVHPVGIDPNDFLPGLRPDPPAKGRSDLSRILGTRRLILGVDRLDYTKGIPERILAFEKLFGIRPDLKRNVVFVQIASPSRSDVSEYADQKRRVEALMGRVNGELGEHDWVPIRYLYRTYPRDFLAQFYRQADIGLVTPLRDGMNLVAKEFIAAQNPESPGVLVLSRCAGAAQELEEAVLVNPFIPSDIAEGIARGLEMPLAERRDRHAALLRKVLSGTAEDWGRRFVQDLGADSGESLHAGAPAEVRLKPRPVLP